MRPIIAIFFLITSTAFGQIPDGYYDNAVGLSGQQLREALHDIIDGHQSQSYSSLWTHFQSTDDKSDGKVWDMYSDVPGGNPAYTYTFVSDQCGNYSAEGDCYNREHSFPKSWFDDQAPMVTDLFHIYPTDGFVNGKRSNYPFGEISNYSWISTNGSKVGNCSYTGYSGLVFEPIDEYKGDFARTYFYMMTRYVDLVSSWNSDMLSGDDLAYWAKEMLLEWDANDPVNSKETDRNNAVYEIQNNRNPFIDHPEFTGSIWGEATLIKDRENLNVKLWYTGDYIHIENPTGTNGQMIISSILGSRIGSRTINSSSTDIQVNLKNGIYIVYFYSAMDMQSFKFIVTNN